MAESNQRNLLIAGIFVLCGLLLLGFLIMEYGPLQHWVRRPYKIKAVFSDAQNLIKGAPVRRAGTPIGKVASTPELIEGLKGVQVELDIYPEFKIPKNSQLKISSVGLMGDSAVDVVPPPPDKMTGEFIAAGETVDGLGSTDLTAVATKMTDEASEVMKDIRSGLAELNKTIARLNAGLLSDANVKNVSASLASLNRSIEKFENTVLSEENVASVHDSITMAKTTMQNVSTASVNARSAIEKFNKAMDHLGPGMKGFAGAADTLHDATNALEALLKEARSGRGLLYALLNDSLLRDNLQRLVANLRQRGILFYKDKEPPAPAPVPQQPPPAKRSSSGSRRR
jgi:phospholipid/cholesterol/gamma-HCH transport system substrate-binding protein